MLAILIICGMFFFVPLYMAWDLRRLRREYDLAMVALIERLADYLES